MEKRLAKAETERTRLLVQQHNLKELYLLSLRAQSLAAKSGHGSAAMDEQRFREVLKVLEIETGTVRVFRLAAQHHEKRSAPGEE